MRLSTLCIRVGIALGVLLVTTTTSLAQSVRTVPLLTPTEWSDPAALVDPAYPVGPYRLTALPFPWLDEPWVGTRTDRVGPLVAQTMTYWTPLTNQLLETLYVDHAAYRRAWWIGTRFDLFGPACYCWQAVQGSVHETLGLPTQGREWGAYEELLQQASRWDEAVGRWLDWRTVYVVTATDGTLEWLVGAPQGQPPEPGNPEPELPTPVPEPLPAPLLLLAVACGVLVRGGTRRWR